MTPTQNICEETRRSEHRFNPEIVADITGSNENLRETGNTMAIRKDKKIKKNP